MPFSQNDIPESQEENSYARGCLSSFQIAGEPGQKSDVMMAKIESIANNLSIC
jgi:hypothetical protein